MADTNHTDNHAVEGFLTESDRMDKRDWTAVYTTQYGVGVRREGMNQNSVTGS